MATDEAATAAETLSLLQTLVTSVQELSAASSLQQEKNDEFARRLAKLGEGVRSFVDDAHVRVAYYLVKLLYTIVSE